MSHPSFQRHPSTRGRGPFKKDGPRRWRGAIRKRIKARCTTEYMGSATASDATVSLKQPTKDERGRGDDRAARVNGRPCGAAETAGKGNEPGSRPPEGDRPATRGRGEPRRGEDSPGTSQTRRRPRARRRARAEDAGTPGGDRGQSPRNPPGEPGNTGPRDPPQARGQKRKRKKERRAKDERTKTNEGTEHEALTGGGGGSLVCRRSGA